MSLTSGKDSGALSAVPPDRSPLGLASGGILRLPAIWRGLGSPGGSLTPGGIEGWSGKRDSNPRPSAWKADALPLSYSRAKSSLGRRIGGGGRIRTFEGVRRQIYSLLPLATRAPLRHFSRRQGRGEPRPTACWNVGAGEGTRTPNHLITNEMLYQLSYASNAREGCPLAPKRADSRLGRARVSRSPRQSRGKAKRQPNRVDYSTPSGCLFPKEQGVTGMNPTALPASLTGRI